MPDEEIVNVMHIAHEIEKYLQDHPKAADSLEGITKWWLSRIHVEETTEVIKKALEVLEQQGIVTKTVSVSSRDIYSCSKQYGSRWSTDSDERVKS